MVLSRLFLHAQYTSKHLMGVALCLGGLALTIISDLNKHTPNANYPQALRGDILCIFGAALYAGSNVMQEDFVKNHNRVRVTLALSSINMLIPLVRFLWGIWQGRRLLESCTELGSRNQCCRWCWTTTMIRLVLLLSLSFHGDGFSFSRIFTDEGYYYCWLVEQVKLQVVRYHSSMSMDDAVLYYCCGSMYACSWYKGAAYVVLWIYYAPFFVVAMLGMRTIITIELSKVLKLLQ